MIMSDHEPGKPPPKAPPATHSTKAEPNPSSPEEAPAKRGRTPTQISEEMRQEILRLKPFYGSRQIGDRLHLSRKIVRRILDEEDQTPSPEKLSEPKSKLEPYREQIEERVKKQLSTTRILREIETLGYQGGRTILAEHVRELKSRITPSPAKGVKRRFETRLGEEMQIDWSPMHVLIAGVLVVVHVLGVLLCASRKLFFRCMREERQSILLEGLASAFEYFGGTALRLVLDNMSTAVLGRIGRDRKPIWHPRFLDFTRHYGVEPFACRPRDPNRKGKKEKSFRLVYDDFLKGTDFASWEDLDQRRRIWLDETPNAGNLRVHGTTRRVPNEAFESERPLLIQLPERRFPVYEDGVRLVDADSTISIAGTPYTVPASLERSRSVAVRLYAEYFEVVDAQGKIAFSRRYAIGAEKGRLQIDPTHYASLPPRPPQKAARGERLDEAFLVRFPGLAPFVEGLAHKMKALAPIHLRALLRLAERYGETAFVASASRAQEYRRFDALAVERILEQDFPPPEPEPIAPLAGAGPVALGEVEPGSLEVYDELDRTPPTPKPEEDDDHGA
jgi:transposase